MALDKGQTGKAREKQNEWMDEYRAEGGESAENAPISGGANLAARTAELVAACQQGHLEPARLLLAPSALRRAACRTRGNGTTP